MNYDYVLTAFYSQPWAIMPQKLLQIRDFLHFAAAGGKASEEEIKAAIGARRPSGTQMSGRIALVPCYGTICQRFGMMTGSGGISIEELGNTLDGLVADKQVKCIIMDFDSPGGSVAGTGELAEKIRGYRGQKKCYALVNSLCASAAYYLASQCREVYSVPAGMMGSIGTIWAHDDLSKYLEEQGVKTTLVYAGRYKAEGNPYEKLGDEAKGEMQEKVDYFYNQFVEAVARGRDTTPTRVKADFGQGRLMTAAQAKAAGMIDGIKTMEQLLSSLGAYDGSPPKASVDIRRRQLDLEELD